MTLQEIKAAVESGQRVFWKNSGYEVRKDIIGQWNIVCLHNQNCIGLTWSDEVTLNGREKEFYIGPKFVPRGDVDVDSSNS